MKTYLYLAQIVIAVAVSVLVLLQARNAGLSNMFGSTDMGIYKTRRGVEKTMFNATIGLGVAFMLLALLTVIITG
ncbi:MAG: preprotein translocase subunit SecG [Chloroflexi bacterium]|nr:preprotein translocase subunit SecG [Chloroflexota bacterium]